MYGRRRLVIPQKNERGFDSGGGRCPGRESGAQTFFFLPRQALGPFLVGAIEPLVLYPLEVVIGDKDRSHKPL
jgi:hypothetical protein